MKNLGTIISAIGLVIFGMMALLRRVGIPEDFENMGMTRGAIFPIMLVGIAIFGLGYFITKRAEK